MQPDSVVNHPLPGLQTMVGTHALKSAAAHVMLHGNSCAEDAFSIHAVHTEHHRHEARQLVHHRYVQRGYRREHPQAARHEHNVLTLSAIGAGGTLGTLGIRFDVAQGLSADVAFADEMSALRGQGRRICEFTQLALDYQAASKPVLAALFHTAYLHAYKMYGVEMLVIEVNPRHVPYYRRMLHFKVCSDVKTNTQVHAPAVLMSLDLVEGEQLIARYAGHPQMMSVVRNLYPLFFSPEREAEILAQLREEYRLDA